jgi:hypothetical protein
MADAPTGTQGLPRGGAPEFGDLNIAAGGGAKFMTRLQQLMDAKEQSEQALASLQLGEDVAAAWAHFNGSDCAQNQRGETSGQSSIICARHTVQAC